VTPASVGRLAYYAAMRLLLDRFATRRLAVSKAAAKALYGSVSGVEIVACARDLSRVSSESSMLSSGRVRIGHVGRPAREKNRELLFDLVRRNPDFELLVTGHAPEHPRIRWVDSAADVHREADCFAFPSLREGLGLAVVEAQAAGLPCVVSDAIPQEACVVPELWRVVPLAAPREAWADALRAAARLGRRPEAAQLVRQSRFDIRNNRAALEEIYAGA
jgi:glycosyltransferase involved in cell wall biosynthesis